MIKVIIVLALLLILSVTVLILTIRKNISLSKDLKLSKRINENYSTAVKRIEDNIKNANEEKKKLNTGNPVDNVTNATNIMRDISNKQNSRR